MGLLDNFSGAMDDPQTMGLLSAAGGMFQASGPSLMPHSFGQVLGAGLQGYQQGYHGQYQQNQLEKMNELEMLSKKVGLQQAMLRLGYLKDAGGQGQDQSAQPALGANVGAAPSAGGAPDTSTGFTPPADRQAAAPQQAPQVSPGGNRQLQSLYGLAMADGKLDTAYQIKKDMLTGFARDAGKYYIDPATGQQTFMADPTKGMGFDPNTKTVTGLNGFNDVNAGIEGAKTAATVRATNNNTLAPLDRLNPITGRPYNMTTGQLIGSMSAPQGDQDQFSQLPPATRALIRKVQATDPDGEYGFNFAGADGSRVQGEAPPANGFSGFAGPADLATGAAQVKLATDPLIKLKTDLLSKAHDTNAATLGKLQDTVRSEYEIQNRNKQLLPLLDKIQTGGFAPEGRIGFANSLQTSGLVPDSLKPVLGKWVANGDPTTGKVVENQLAAAGIKTMLDTLDKEGKPNRAIFEAIQNAQESVKSGNATLKQVFALQKQLYDMHFQQEQDMSHAIASPEYNPLTMQADFSKRRNDSLGATPAAAAKTATLSDIAATARASGKSTAQVTADMRAAGYTIGGQ